MKDGIVKTFDLTKIYKLKNQKQDLRALDNVNISIKEGEIFGLLGPNGAGKTTMIQILTTIKNPTSGYATIGGHNILKKPKQAKERIALMLEHRMLYFRITGYDNLKFFCKIYKVPHDKARIHAMAEEFGLNKWLNQYVENYSNGMMMKLALCRTLLLNRSILILDEPTLGLDVQTRAFIINKLKSLNKTILLTSHDMGVVERLCDRIAFIKNGKIVKFGTKEDIKQLAQAEIKIEIEIFKNKSQLRQELTQQEFVKEIFETHQGLTIIINNRNDFNDLLLTLGKYPVLKLKEYEPTLEDLFIKFA